jgi:hypothetical protein
VILKRRRAKLGFYQRAFDAQLIPLVETQIMRRQQAETRTADFAKRWFDEQSGNEKVSLWGRRSPQDPSTLSLRRRCAAITPGPALPGARSGSALWASAFGVPRGLRQGQGLAKSANCRRFAKANLRDKFWEGMEKRVH